MPPLENGHSALSATAPCSHAPDALMLGFGLPEVDCYELARGVARRRRDGRGTSVTLPTSANNRFGYDIEFDARGRFGPYAIDFDALGELLFQLHAAGRVHGAPVKLVIFDQAYMPALLRTPRGSFLRSHVTFMAATPWVRHDEHIHVNFDVPCKRQTAYWRNLWGS